VSEFGASVGGGGSAPATTRTVGNPKSARAPRLANHTILRLTLIRTGLGLLTLLIVSIVVFAATQVLPGNAAYAVLGHYATEARVRTVEAQLHLNRPAVVQYWDWLTGVLTGHFGTSLADGVPVSSLVGPRIANSAVLVLLSGAIGTAIAVILGSIAAVRRGGIFDEVSSVIALAITSLPEFVVAVGLIIIFAANLSHMLPAVSVIPPGVAPWREPSMLVLPVAALVIAIVPYIFRMVRASMIEALESDYVEMAQLKGVPMWRIVLSHALPNAIAPTIQVIGLSFLYLAGGIVIVEDIFDYPGIGQGLVNAVTDRDIPVIQLTVILLGAFYVVVNIVCDIVALVATPRRRIPR
jgi:peptide/nickel transport system permease protein